MILDHYVNNYRDIFMWITSNYVNDVKPTIMMVL